MKSFKFFFFTALVIGVGVVSYAAETLPPLKGGHAPGNFDEMWAGFDPRTEPLEVEVLKSWEEAGVVLKVVRFHIGVFKGQKARLAAVYGYSKAAIRGGAKLPGLLQIHGGGQFADYRACLMNAKRGYATLSIAWAGRINAPGYVVTPNEVKLFWGKKTGDPKYNITTDWGAVDGYHAPGRNPGNQFPSIKPAAWTLDKVESPRNSGWFLCALAARRALTFLEKQPEVDSGRLGVYGHSMGGKLTVMTAVDPRVKAAAPSCGGISDRYSSSRLFRDTIGDNVSLKQVSCPIIFLSPANDFHGRIGDLPTATREISSKHWRVTCSPHHNHQDTPQYEVATLLWFDQHLKKTFELPAAPLLTLDLKSRDHVPAFTVRPDSSRRVLSVDVYYTQQGKPGEQPQDRENTMHRFWHHAKTTQTNGTWTGQLPLISTDKPLWVYANVTYPLEKPVAGAGYYYGTYTTGTFNLSSLVQMVAPQSLKASGIQATRSPNLQIENFEGAWEKQWFTYRQTEWARTTHKIHAPVWKAPKEAQLVLKVQATQPNKLVLVIDEHAAEIPLAGGAQWQDVVLTPGDLRNLTGKPLPSWEGIRRLKLTHGHRLRPQRGDKSPPKMIGGNWRGPKPQFRELRWQPSFSFLDRSPLPAAKKNYTWTPSHMHVGVRWQPFSGRPKCNAYDATRPVIAKDSSYVQFWASWAAIEPTPAHTNYQKTPSPSLQEIERAVEVCRARGLKVEFVFFHCPAWASESGKAGGFKPKKDLFTEYVKRIATHFKGRVHAYQLNHEANLQGMMDGADIHFVINDILRKGAQTIRSVYQAKPATPVLISTTGMSPCRGCTVTKGLTGKGGPAVDHFYDLMIATPQLMKTVDALNLNVSDQNNGYGYMDDKYVPSVWGNYELVRRKLDAAGYSSKSVLSAESWISWDDGGSAVDVNQDGVKNEKDAYVKAITILGRCLERGLNTINLPWSDNSSGWAMGLTKRRDYNGRVKRLKPGIVIPSRDGGPDIVTSKVQLRGGDGGFVVANGSGNVFNVADYINPPDPNHLHYYIWRWYAQITCGADEVIRHAVAGEKGNDILITGPAFVGKERYRISSYNRTRKYFTVLLYASDANGRANATIVIPAKIKTGIHYNNSASTLDFRGEGFSDGDTYFVRIITKDIHDESGADLNPFYLETEDSQVVNGRLLVEVPKMNRFTVIKIVKHLTESKQ